jgi:hypothetical protein
MNLNEINKRIELLRDVFSYSLLHKRTLSIGQRICLSQERAALLACREALDYDYVTKATPRYVLPNHLNLKVKLLEKTIIETNWVKPPYEPLF